MISGFDTTKSQLYHAAPVHLSIVRACRITAFALTGAVAAASGLALVGWAVARPALATPFGGSAAMHPLTAIGFLLIAFALFPLLPGVPGRVETGAARGLAVAAAIVAGTKLVVARADGPHAWLILLAIALAVALLDTEIRGWRPAQALLVIGALPLSIVVLVGFLFGVTELYGWGAYTPMARVPAVSLLALEIAVLAGRVEFGVTRIFVVRGAGGVTARRLLPAVVVLPLAIGYLRLLGQRRGLYGPEFGVVLFTLAMMALFSILVWLTARNVHRVDLAHAEADLRLHALIRNVPLGVVVLDLDGRVQLCNNAFIEMFHYSEHELLGQKVDDLIAPEGDAGETASLTRRGFAGESVRRSTVRRRRDGTLIDVELYVVPLALNGRPVGTYGVYRALADRRAPQARARDAGIA